MGASALIGVGTRRGRGRPAHTLLVGFVPEKKARGRPRGSTKHDGRILREWFTQIEAHKAEMAARLRRRVYAAEAIRSHMITHYRSRGWSQDRARRAAEKNLPRLEVTYSRIKRSIRS